MFCRFKNSATMINQNIITHTCFVALKKGLTLKTCTFCNVPLKSAFLLTLCLWIYGRCGLGFRTEPSIISLCLWIYGRCSLGFSTEPSITHTHTHTHMKILLRLCKQYRQTNGSPLTLQWGRQQCLLAACLSGPRRPQRSQRPSSCRPQ